MLTLITGPAGVGKTVITLKKLSLVKNSPKYATPSASLNFSYKEHNLILLPHLSTWQDLPSGSLIFCDDATQYISDFDYGESKPPLWLRELAIHRQKSIDIIFVALTPLLISRFIQPLISEHIHYAFGDFDGSVTALKWSHFVSNPNSEKSWNQAEIEYLKLFDFFSGVK